VPVRDCGRSSEARHHGSRFAADPARMRRHKGARAPGLEAQTMTALLAWSVSGPPGTAAGHNETSTPRPRGVPHGALARNLASSKFREQRGVFIARGISVGIGDRASGEAARMGSALPCRGGSTSPTTEHLARDVPERSEDEARPVTGAAHAGRR
jgi:hypothetical protein